MTACDGTKFQTTSNWTLEADDNNQEVRYIIFIINLFLPFLSWNQNKGVYLHVTEYTFKLLSQLSDTLGLFVTSSPPC